MKEDKEQSVFISPSDLVTVTRMNHIIEVQYMQRMNRNARIKKLDKDRYLNINTGEVKDIKHIENRSESFNSLRQSFKKLRYLINNNFTGKGNELHVTLTYAENMTDTVRLYRDNDKFMKRLRYKYKNISSIDYLNVIEPQERGAWHNHLLLRFNDLDKIYIPNDEMAKIWGHGFVTIRSLKEVDNIGAYLSAYLTDIELTEDNIKKLAGTDYRVITKQVDGQEKRFVKGGRLHLYPPGINLYRKSAGIKFPVRERMLYGDTKKVVGPVKPHYEKTYSIENENFDNIIHYEQYNLKRL